MNDVQALGSQIARNGFANEVEIADKFNNWVADKEAQRWLTVMNYNLFEIEYVRAVVLKCIIPKPKSDVNVQITIKLKEAIGIENISVKLVSNEKGFNQIDKRKVSRYVEMWNIPSDVAILLKYFTGELPPYTTGTRDDRRMFLDEFSLIDCEKVLAFFDDNKSLVLSDILRGRGEFAVEWVLVAQKIENNARWVLKNINDVINHYSGAVKMSPQGSIMIGTITVQRKGGTPDPTSLQFKMNPAELFDL